MYRVESFVIIDAPPHVVWEVLLDLDSYPVWNRFTPRIALCGSAARLEVGAELDLDCRIAEDKLLRDEHEVILALEPEGLAFCMGTSRRRGRPGIRSRRWQVCQPLEGERTRFQNQESFEGPLAPLVYLLYGMRLRAAFRRYGQDLKRRAEALHATGRG